MRWQELGEVARARMRSVAGQTFERRFAVKSAAFSLTQVLSEERGGGNTQ